MELNGEVANFENKNLFNTLLDKKYIFKLWNVAIYLHLIGNFYKLAH